MVSRYFISTDNILTKKSYVAWFFRLQKHSVLSVVYKIINPKKSGKKELSGMMRKSVSHTCFPPAAYAELFLSRVPVGPENMMPFSPERHLDRVTQIQ